MQAVLHHIVLGGNRDIKDFRRNLLKIRAHRPPALPSSLHMLFVYALLPFESAHACLGLSETSSSNCHKSQVWESRRLALPERQAASIGVVYPPGGYFPRWCRSIAQLGVCDVCVTNPLQKQGKVATPIAILLGT